MQIQRQFSVFMVNKPGVLAKVLNEFAQAHINLMAMTMMDSVEHGVMRLVGASPDSIRALLDRLNMQYSETDVLCVTLSNQPGALAAVTQRLSEAHINIAYAYVTAGARGGKTTGVLKVADVKKAMRVLQNAGLGASAKANAKTKGKATIRRPPTSRR